jgi:hypothetical protein
MGVAFLLKSSMDVIRVPIDAFCPPRFLELASPESASFCSKANRNVVLSARAPHGSQPCEVAS